MEFHHAGIATTDVTALTDQYTTLFETTVAHREQIDGMDLRFLSIGEAFFELLEPAADGPIARFLDQHGPGVHHLAVAVPSVPAALDRAREIDIDPLDEQPRPGAWGHQVAFLHPADTGHVLIEFVADS